MRTTTTTIVALVGITACEWNSERARIDASTQPRPDMRMTTDPDGDVDGDPTATPRPLLSEVTLTPAGGAEFIEITNFTGTDLSLADYYLSDSGEYWRLPGGVPTINVSDFIVEFPATAMLAAGASITVATGTATAFNTTYGRMPTYSIADSTVTRTTVPGTPTLTDAGEIIVLFYWDGTAALVGDVDIMIAGNPTAANGLISKSGMMVAGSTYATDANTIQSQTGTPSSGASTKRTMLEAGRETQAGTGNGIDGDDETSEDSRMTWDSTFLAPTPGAAPVL